jgi:hypothetical protein
MVLVHHPALAVNAEVPEAHVPIVAERGWLEGLHPDTDPDDDRPIPRVLADPVAEPSVGEVVGLDRLTKADLVELAAEAGVEVPSGATKAELVDLLGEQQEAREGQDKE